MASVRMKLETRRQKKDSTYPLVFRVYHKSMYYDIQTGHSLTLRQFNAEKQTIVGNKELTNELRKVRDRYQGKLVDFLSTNEGASIKDVKEFFTKRKNGPLTFKEFWESWIQQLNTSGKGGTAKTQLQSLKRISKIVDLEKRMEKVSYADLVKIESELLKDGVSANTISVYLRSMRSIYNKAIKMDLVDQIYYPFHKFAIKQTKTMPRNISLQDMQKYFALKLPFSHRYQKAYIIGKLIFLLCGINLKDLLLLNKDNIRGDRIVYQRSKTKRLYSVKILPETKMILEPMLKHSGETLLCVLDNYLKYYKDSISFEAKYTEKRKLINKHLKWISFFAYIDDKITSYTFRYSFANIAKDIGVSNEIIAALLGHSYGNAVTSIYLNNYNQEELDKAHEMIVNAVLKNPQI